MKIKNLRVKSFRGIPEDLELSFTDKNLNPTSTIIYGDNGSGKSSIVDAIEFNLQGRIERITTLNSEFKPHPISYKNEELQGSQISIEFEDNSKSNREIKVEFREEQQDYRYSTVPSGFHPSFKLAPIVLRRNDIISYASTPTKSKQVLFLSFVYGTEGGQKSTVHKDQELISRLNRKRTRLKRDRRELVSEIAERINVPMDEIPYGNIQQLNDFIRKNIRKGLTSKQYQILLSKGKISGIDEGCLLIAKDLVKLTNSIHDIQKQIGNASKSTDRNVEIKIQIKKFLESTSSILTEAFKNISTANFIEEINLSIGRLTEMSCEIEIKLSNGKITYPNRVFSEANLDLLILLLFTSIIKQSSKHGQSKVLILDDVLQSVDSTIRLNFIEYLIKNFHDWQLIITAHDRLWLDQLKHAFRRNQKTFKCFEIDRWDFSKGPRVSNSSIDNNLKNSLTSAVKLGNAQIIASQSGIFMEYMCHKLSMNLNTSIQRRLDDKYTIGDLWPGIMKFFKKTEIAELTQKVNKLLHIRNLMGAHYNEWAVSLTNSEVHEFADSLLEWYKKVFCEICQDFIFKDKSCRCKKLNIE